MSKVTLNTQPIVEIITSYLQSTSIPFDSHHIKKFIVDNYVEIPTEAVCVVSAYMDHKNIQYNVKDLEQFLNKNFGWTTFSNSVKY